MTNETESKSVTTTKWAAKELSDSQLIYAANDAYAAIKVFHSLTIGQKRPMLKDVCRGEIARDH